jgi:hypothetical protein
MARVPTRPGIQNKFLSIDRFHRYLSVRLKLMKAVV